MTIFGGEPQYQGIGMMVSVNECGLVASWSSPKAQRIAQFSSAVASAVEAIVQRAITVSEQTHQTRPPL